MSQSKPGAAPTPPAPGATLKPERIGLWQIQEDGWSRTYTFPSYEINVVFLNLVTGLLGCRRSGLAIHWTELALTVELHPESGEPEEIESLERVARTLETASAELGDRVN